jgi:cell division protein FtsW
MSSAVAAQATVRRRRSARAAALPVEHSLLLTATLCLLALGAVMVYSASCAVGVPRGSGSGTGELVSFVLSGLGSGLG